MSSVALTSTSVLSDSEGRASTNPISEQNQSTNGRGSHSPFGHNNGDPSTGNDINKVSKLQQQQVVEQNDYCVLAFYQFFSPKTEIVNDNNNNNDNDAVGVSNHTDIEDLSIIERQWRDDIDSKLRSYHTYGMIRISIYEGMNGTICFPTSHLDTIQSFLQQQQYYSSSRRRTGGHEEHRDNNTPTIESLSSSSSSPFKIRISYFNTPPFHRLSVRIKKEIVTMGPIPKHWISRHVDDLDEMEVGEDHTTTATAKTCIVRPYSRPKSRPNTVIPTNGEDDNDKDTGMYVPPGPEWDDLLYDPQCLVIDTRNEYEIQMGTFANAVSPHIQEFTEFPQWLHDTIQPSPQSLPQQPRYNKIAMFCTGGIRCEKATALCIQMLHKSSSLIRNSNNGDDDTISIPPVYHLEGGILAYLENKHPHSNRSTTLNTTSDIAASDQTNERSNDHIKNETDTAVPTPHSYGNNFVGECFVFDQRVAVTYGLQPTQQYVSCHACRRPVHVDVTTNTNEKYQKEVCCPACYIETIHGSMNTIGKIQQQRYIERQKQMELAAQNLSQKPHLYDSKYIQ